MSRCCIVYGSETGNTEVASFSTYLYFRRNGVPVEIHLADFVTPKYLSSFECVLFFVPTCAFGEFPHNFESFINSLINIESQLDSAKLNVKENKGYLEKLKYTIFGLGDSRYPLYNFAARRLQSLLKSLGAAEFFPLAFGDEQHPLGYSGELIPWRNDLLNYFNEIMVVNNFFEEDCFERYTLPFTITFSEPISQSTSLTHTSAGADLPTNNTLNDYNIVDINCLDTKSKSSNNVYTLSRLPKIVLGDNKSDYKTGRVVCNKIITSESHFSNVRTIVIETKSPAYKTGDVFCCLPTDNTAGNMLKTINLDPNMILKISYNPNFNSSNFTIQTVLSVHNEHNLRMFSKNFGNPIRIMPESSGFGSGSVSSRKIEFDKFITLEELFSKYLCLRNICTPFQMHFMSMYTNNKLHKEKLQEMAGDTIEGCLEYYRYCWLEKRSFYDVLYDFPTVRLPLEILINICNPYYSRLYSISSSEVDFVNKFLYTIPRYPNSLNYFSLKQFLDHKYNRSNRIELCVGSVKYVTPYKRRVEGLNSAYFSNLMAEDKVDFLIYKPLFSKLISNVEIPVLFIATGTGITVIKPFIQFRAFKLKEIWKNYGYVSNVNDLAFIGFRRPNQDHLYTDFQMYKSWCRFIFVYSRASKTKFYVQDSIRLNSTIVYPVLRDGLVLIGGKSHPMPSQVLEALAFVLEKEAGFGSDAAKRFIDDSIKENKIIIDSWG
uniref:Oxidoreductase, putative n=1 Tax=Theileria annulata TaxID=5874 RepID=A0A3B0MGY6_THEAN